MDKIIFSIGDDLGLLIKWAIYVEDRPLFMLLLITNGRYGNAFVFTPIGIYSGTTF